MNRKMMRVATSRKMALAVLAVALVMFASPAVAHADETGLLIGGIGSGPPREPAPATESRHDAPPSPSALPVEAVQVAAPPSPAGVAVEIPGLGLNTGSGGTSGGSGKSTGSGSGGTAGSGSSKSAGNSGGGQSNSVGGSGSHNGATRIEHVYTSAGDGQGSPSWLPFVPSGNQSAESAPSAMAISPAILLAVLGVAVLALIAIVVSVFAIARRPQAAAPTV